MRTTAGEATADAVVEGLDADGYVIVGDLLDPDEIGAARDDLGRVLASTPTGRNDFEGRSTQRVYALFAKTRTFDAAAVHPLPLDVLDRVLGHYRLTAPVGIRRGPGQSSQIVHRADTVSRHP